MRIGLLLLIVFTSAKGFTQKDTTYRFLTAGFNAEYVTVRFELNEKSCFIQYYPVAGCILSDALEDSINVFNHNTDSLMRLQFGNDWEEEYKTQQLSKMKELERINSILIHQDFIKEKLKKLNLSYSDLNIFARNSDRKGWQLVHIYYVDPDSKYNIEYQLFELEVQPEKIKIKVKDTEQKRIPRY